MPILPLIAVIVVPHLVFSRRVTDVGAWLVTLLVTAPLVCISATVVGWAVSVFSGHPLSLTTSLLAFGLPVAGLVSYAALSD